MSASYSSSLPCHLLACCSLSSHHVHCIAYVFVSCIRAFSHLSVLQSGAPMPSGVALFVSCCEWVLNFLGMARGFPSSLGIAPVDRLSSFVPFGGRLVLQRLTGNRKGLFCVQPNTPSKVAQNPSNSPPCYRSFDHDRVGENHAPFGLS